MSTEKSLSIRNSCGYFEGRVSTRVLYLGLVCVFTLAVSKFYFHPNSLDSIPFFRESRENVNELDGCYHVYLDCGSNRGVQVRKLFEPHLYPGAGVIPVFNKYFGEYNKRKTVCSVGFEPNQNHEPYLKMIEKSYTKCGYRVIFKTITAVGDYDGRVRFYSDLNEENFEWGGGIVKSRHTSNKKRDIVSVMRLASYINNVVAKREVAKEIDEKDPPMVIMKVDIEGSENDLIFDLAMTGALQHVDAAFIEWHEFLHQIAKAKQKTASARVIMREFSKFTKFESIDLDDESYFTSDQPLPDC